jgi:hypothetical protein
MAIQATTNDVRSAEITAPVAPFYGNATEPQDMAEQPLESSDQWSGRVANGRALATDPTRALAPQGETQLGRSPRVRTNFDAPRVGDQQFVLMGERAIKNLAGTINQAPQTLAGSNGQEDLARSLGDIYAQNATIFPEFGTPANGGPGVMAGLLAGFVQGGTPLTVNRLTGFAQDPQDPNAILCANQATTPEGDALVVERFLFDENRRIIEHGFVTQPVPMQASDATLQERSTALLRQVYTERGGDADYFDRNATASRQLERWRK